MNRPPPRTAVGCAAAGPGKLRHHLCQVTIDSLGGLCYTPPIMTTTLPNAKQLGRQWVLIDAKDKVLGRLASRIALMLRGKHKPTFTPFLDTGDFVVVINAEKIAVTGQKLSQKIYQR